MTDEGDHPAGFVLFQIVTGDAVDKLCAHFLGELMGEYHGFGKTQGILMGDFRRGAILTVTFSGGWAHLAHVEFRILENGGAHIVVIAVELALKMLGPGILKGHNVLELFRQRLHKPVKGGAGRIGKLPNQRGIGAVQTPALPIGDDLHGIGLRCPALFHKLGVDGAVLCAEHLEPLLLLLLHHQHLGTGFGGGTGSGSSGMTGAQNHHIGGIGLNNLRFGYGVHGDRLLGNLFHISRILSSSFS